MTPAKVLLKGTNRELGWWEFATVPRVGELLAVTVDDAPSSFEVAGLIHVPIVKGALGTGKHPVPYVVVVVEEPKSVQLDV